MNNQMILELVNAGCDLRKLSPEFLEKLCGVYENHSAAVLVNKKPTKAEAIEALQEVASGNDATATAKMHLNELIRSIDNGCDMTDQAILRRLDDLTRVSLNGLPRALRLVRESLS